MNKNIINNTQERTKIAKQVTIFGSFISFVLMILKIAAGIMGRSSALIADGVHSLSDFATDLVVLGSMHMSAKPRDGDHHYGHGKFETMAALVIGVALIMVAFGIAWHGIQTIISMMQGRAEIKSPTLIAVMVAFISILLKELLFHLTVRVAKKIDSRAIYANAWHHRSDAISSIATFLGTLGAMKLGENWIILDPIAAIVVALMIIKTGVDIAKESMQELLEASLPDEMDNEILGIISCIPGVLDPHNLKTRKIGSTIAIDVHIRVLPHLLITEAHIIATHVECELRASYGDDTFVSIHVEPELFHDMSKIDE